MNDDQRESLVSQMLKRLSESTLSGGKRKKKSKKFWLEQGLSIQEIEEKQKALFQNSAAEDDSDELYYRQNNQEGTDESKSIQQNNSGAEQQGDAEYWANFKSNWISFNQATLDQEYANWVKSHIDYNA
jgi:hypothetical protein